MKWTDFYSSEQELIEDMLKTKSNVKEYYYNSLVRGYEYIEGFKRYYQKHGELTPKQMTQLKRLAEAIYRNTKG